MQRCLNRRQFLAITSTAALTTPFLLHAADAASARKGPNDRITLGFIAPAHRAAGY